MRCLLTQPQGALSGTLLREREGARSSIDLLWSDRRFATHAGRNRDERLLRNGRQSLDDGAVPLLGGHRTGPAGSRYRLSVVEDGQSDVLNAEVVVAAIVRDLSCTLQDRLVPWTDPCRDLCSTAIVMRPSWQTTTRSHHEPMPRRPAGFTRADPDPGSDCESLGSRARRLRGVWPCPTAKRPMLIASKYFDVKSLPWVVPSV